MVGDDRNGRATLEVAPEKMQSLARRQEDTPGRVAIGSSSVPRSQLEAATQARPKLVAELLAAEPRTTPAIVRRPATEPDELFRAEANPPLRAPNRRRHVALPPITKPPPIADDSGEIGWPAAPSRLPLVIVSILIATIAAILVLH